MKNTQNINKAYLLSLVCNQIKTVEVSFNFDSPEYGQSYTYLTVLDLSVGEDVIVEANDELKVAVVTKVHEEAQIEPHATWQYKWAVSKSGTKARSEQERLHKLQKEALEQIAKAKKKAERKKLQEQLKEHFGDELNEIQALPFSEGLE